VGHDVELIVGIALGLGLAAAAGFRIFVPLLLVGLAAHSGHIHPADGFAWLATKPAIIMLAVATFLEIIAYHVPWLDNLLDVVATPAAFIAGTVLMASSLFELDPLWRWSLALIAGGGAAGLLHGAAAGTRLVSSATTGGLANPAVATTETAAAFALSAVALMLPLLGVLLAVAMAVFLGRKLARGGRSLFRRRSPD
jgi:hypothetical protein